MPITTKLNYIKLPIPKYKTAKTDNGRKNVKNGAKKPGKM